MKAEITVVCSAWHKQQDLNKFFDQHARSLLNQSIPVNVLYIADGGMKLSAPGPLMQVVTTPMGISTAQAFNIGLALTDTEFFCALNLDDYFFRDALEIQLETLKTRNADAVFGDWEIRRQPEADFARGSRDLSELRPCTTWPPEAAPGLRLGSGDRARGTWGPAPVFRTQAVRDAYGYPRFFGNGAPVKTIIDFILWRRLLELDKNVIAMQKVFGTYYSNPQQQQEFRSGASSIDDEHALLDRFGALT